MILVGVFALLSVCPSECLSGGSESVAATASDCHESAPGDSPGSEHPHATCCVLAGGPSPAGISTTASATFLPVVLDARVDDRATRLFAAPMRRQGPPRHHPAPFLARSPILLI